MYGTNDIFVDNNIIDINSWGEFGTETLRSMIDQLEIMAAGGLLELPEVNTTGFSGVNSTINIALAGVGHWDYFTDPDVTYDSGDTKALATEFLAILSKRAIDAIRYRTTSEVPRK